MGAEDIRSGSGRAFLAPYGTALPDDIADMASLPVAYVDLGEVSEDGLDHAFGVDKQVIKNWDGDPVKTVALSAEATFKLTFLETSGDVLRLYYGAEFEEAGTGSKIPIGTPADLDHVMVIVVEDKATGKIKGYSLPRVQCMDRENLSEKPGDAGYGLTFQALKDSVSGKAGWLLLDDDFTTGA